MSNGPQLLMKVNQGRFRLLRAGSWCLLAVFVALFTQAAFALPFNQDMVGGQLIAGSMMRQKDPHSIPAEGLDRQYPDRKVIVETWQNPFKGGSDSALRGERLFKANCAVCHGNVSGGQHVPSDLMAKGMPSINLLLTQTKFDPTKTDGYIWAYVFWGMDAIMPRYGYKFSNNEIWDLVSYIRKLQQDNPIG